MTIDIDKIKDEAFDEGVEALYRACITAMAEYEDNTVEEQDITEMLKDFNYKRKEAFEPTPLYLNRLAVDLIDPDTRKHVVNILNSGKKYFMFEGRVNSSFRVAVRAEDEDKARNHLEMYTNLENYTEDLEIEELECVGSAKHYDEECEEA